jgi:hypothetical protein
MIVKRPTVYTLEIGLKWEINYSDWYNGSSTPTFLGWSVQPRYKLNA